MTYCKDYCEEKGISTSKLNEAQKTLYYIAENMKMEESISEEGYKHFQMAIKALEQQYLNPEADREESKAYCAECDHIEMCSWYPHDGCEWLKTDRYNAGYNAAKREIALSGEYERAYERGKADAHPDINDGKLSEIPTGSEREE